MKILNREVSPELILKMADDHIQRYENMIASGSKNVRVYECQIYLDIWLDVKDSVNHGIEFSRRELNEIKDALIDGGYDE